MKKAILYLATLLMAVSCVYPFEAETGLSDGRLVVEGDIIVGGISSFNLTYMSNINGNSPADIRKDYSGVTIQCSDGSEISGKFDMHTEGIIKATFDTRNLNPDLEYRLWIRLSDKEYASSWAKCEGSLTVDDLYYEVDEEKTALAFFADITATGSRTHFRYGYSETWEYHSVIFATHYYRPSQTFDNPSLFPYGAVTKYDDGESPYYCWNNGSSRGIDLISTSTLSSNEFKGIRLKSVGKTDTRIMICYKLEAQFYPISDECAKYLAHVKEGSTYNGDLFSPSPSEMTGNISNLADRTDLVIGYVEVTREFSKSKFFFADDLNYYSPAVRMTSQDVPDQWRWPQMYAAGYDCYASDQGQYLWTQKRCCDCRKDGGSRTKPEGWPTIHE